MHRANVTGSMVLIASMSGHVSNLGINTSAYNASKAAVHQLARSLAAEWGHPQNTFPGSTATATNPNPSIEPRKLYPPIRVNTLSPGHIDTPLSEAARVRGLTDEWASQNMLGRISQPEEYRAPVLFLLSAGSSYMTGAVSGHLRQHFTTNADLGHRTFESMEGIARGSAEHVYLRTAACKAATVQLYMTCGSIAGCRVFRTSVVSLVTASMFLSIRGPQMIAFELNLILFRYEEVFLY